MEKRLEISKTYKLYIDGKFPRTESGRYYKSLGSNVCLSSRKDFRNAVQAARKAQDSWASRPAYNIGQILYRMAENLEGVKAQFSEILKKEESLSNQKAMAKVEQAIDRIIYFAGWSDKFQQLFSNVNPVASSHFNFTMAEPMGVVSVLSDEEADFLSLLSAILSIMVSGNTVVILAGENSAISAITFAEVINSSDVPAGVINLLTGKFDELESHMASHMDVNGLLYIGKDEKKLEKLKLAASENLKRVHSWPVEKIQANNFESPYAIKPFLEFKTTWHPIEQIGGSKPGY